MLARKLNQVTSLGKILDPCADKVTLFSVALCMLIYMVYMTIVAYRDKQFHNNPNETFLKALLYWDEHHEEEVKE